jgi:hypothetical protein
MVLYNKGNNQQSEKATDGPGEIYLQTYAMVWTWFECVLQAFVCWKFGC